MNENIVLRYDKETSMKVGALSYKLYVFMLCIASLIVLISSAIFELICYKNGFSDVIVTKYTSEIIYFSLFLILVWIFSFPVWLPAYFAENKVIVKKDNKLYIIKCKKDNLFEIEKDLDKKEFLDKVVNDLPNSNKKVKIQQFEEYKVLKKNKKNMVISVKQKNKSKKIRIYNVYDNYEKF